MIRTGGPRHTYAEFDTAPIDSRRPMLIGQNYVITNSYKKILQPEATMNWQWISEWETTEHHLDDVSDEEDDFWSGIYDE